TATCSPTRKSCSRIFRSVIRGATFNRCSRKKSTIRISWRKFSFSRMTTELTANGFEIDVVHSRARARTASLKYATEGRFVLSVPAGTTKAWIEKFLSSRKSWMEKTRQKAGRESASRAIAPGTRIATAYYTLAAECDAALRY